MVGVMSVGAMVVVPGQAAVLLVARRYVPLNITPPPGGVKPAVTEESREHVHIST